MKLDKLYIKGFRNFQESIINFNEDTLIIGANDVGKTNLIYALRILLDRGFSDYDLELKESDYNVYEDAKEIIIRAYFSEVKEECIVARMPGKISDDGNLVIQYSSQLSEGKASYTFFAGKDEDMLESLDSPYYRRYMNIKYIGSRRELWGYISKIKKQLLAQAKESREKDVEEKDDALYANIQGLLKEVDEKIPELSYVKNATTHINNELDNLSIHHREQKIVFDTQSSELDQFIANVSITSQHNDKKLLIGGDGRANQIFLSLWASQNQIKDAASEVSIICIEEPEAYLHPHQQRKLASYLSSYFRGQVILTTHSPFIAREFSPNSIIRLYKDDNLITQVASDGCSEIIAKGFDDFGYRMSVVPAEAFFSDCVILIEGPSEEVFYKTLAKQLDINLDRLNISILDVGGIGFKTYKAIMEALKIHWIMRTDNDYFKIPKQPLYRFAGIRRGYELLDLNKCTTEDKDFLQNNIDKLHGLPQDKVEDVDVEILNIAERIVAIMEKHNILLAKIGLEEDLYESPINTEIKKYYGTNTKDETIKAMKEHKAINMFEFLKKEKNCLKKLKDDNLALLLKLAMNYIESRHGAH